MNKKFKKLIATVSAIVMCAVPMTAVNSNAYWFMKSQEQYQAKVDILNNSEFSENCPDLCERFTKLIRWYDDVYDYYKFNQPEKRVENIWLPQEPSKGCSAMPISSTWVYFISFKYSTIRSANSR